MWATNFLTPVGVIPPVDPSPLIVAEDGPSIRRLPDRRPSLRGSARFFRRAGSRRGMRDPSLLVREAAAEQLEERQSDWAYSRPVVFLDTFWNLAFVAAAAGVLVLRREERPPVPLRLWIFGYALQCVLHIVCVWIQYRRKHLLRRAEVRGGQDRDNSVLTSPSEAMEIRGHHADQGQQEEMSSVAKYLESGNTMFSFVWWIIGFYWISVGGQTLTSDAPQLYWLCVVFLAFDVFFVVFCVALACIIGIAVCCCLPCIIAILYAVSDQQEGASDEDILQLPTYKFRRIGNLDKTSSDAENCGGMMTEYGSDSPIEHVLSAEDAECCICLTAYDDGVEVRELPCQHHFHSACIDKWLYINATCPLCKYSITRNNNQAREEV